MQNYQVEQGKKLSRHLELVFLPPIRSDSLCTYFVNKTNSKIQTLSFQSQITKPRPTSAMWIHRVVINREFGWSL